MSIIIYTMPNCPNCIAAKQLLSAKGMHYTERLLSTQEERDGFYAIAGPSVRQMPQIFYKGERIGGLAGLREWLKWKEQQ